MKEVGESWSIQSPEHQKNWGSGGIKSTYQTVVIRSELLYVNL